MTPQSSQRPVNREARNATEQARVLNPKSPATHNLGSRPPDKNENPRTPTHPCGHRIKKGRTNAHTLRDGGNQYGQPAATVTSKKHYVTSKKHYVTHATPTASRASRRPKNEKSNQVPPPRPPPSQKCHRARRVCARAPVLTLTCHARTQHTIPPSTDKQAVHTGYHSAPAAWLPNDGHDRCHVVSPNVPPTRPAVAG